MPTLTPAVRAAATSILLLSIVHIFFWALLAITLRSDLPSEFPYNYFVPIMSVISGAGLLGVFVSIEIFRARNWARIAAIALAAITAFFCALGMLMPLVVMLGGLPLADLGLDIQVAQKNDFVRLFVIYLFVFSLAIWWIFLFSKKSVAAQFSPNAATAAPKKPVCPPPIAFLAWLMIISSALIAISWPLILGRIPAMLFTHIYYEPGSSWIWAVNLVLFLACGIGLLKLQQWSYAATIALHTFWLISLFVSQLSPLYEQYLSTCLSALQMPDSYVVFHFHIPQWISALGTAIPTLLLLAGLFYYRRSFLKAAAESSQH
jgi:hypothetical protein